MEEVLRAETDATRHDVKPHAQECGGHLTRLVKPSGAVRTSPEKISRCLFQDYNSFFSAPLTPAGECGEAVASKGMLQQEFLQSSEAASATIEYALAAKMGMGRNLEPT